jgi:hypothetical protein
MHAFGTDPVNFLNKLVKNQIRDVRIARSEEAREQEEERYSMFFMQPYTTEAVARFSNIYNNQPNPNIAAPALGQPNGT